VGFWLASIKEFFARWGLNPGFALRWLVPSLLLHGALFSWLAALPMPPAEPALVTMEIEMSTPPEDAPRTPAETPEPAAMAVSRERDERTELPRETHRSEEPRPTPEDATSRKPTDTRQTAPSEHGQPSTLEEVPQPEAPEPSTETEGPAPITDPVKLAAVLRPDAVARAVFDPGPIPGKPEGPDPRHAGRVIRGESKEEIEERINALIREGARNKAVSTAPDPELEAHADGSYSFRGPSFSAVIDPEGRVRFDDRHGGWSPWVPFGGTFDLNTMAERAAGNDPHASERRWFMERTADLRERLEKQRHARLAALTPEQIQRHLARLFANSRVPVIQRKQEVLRLWDALGEAADPAGARREVLTFVNERCPLGSACAFQSTELADFNEGRTPRDRFTPYKAEAP